MTAPFDPDRSTAPTRVVPTELVVDLLHIPHAPDPIRRYAEAMRSGDRFPPIAVVRLGRRFVIADGHKRFSACIALQLEEVTVEVWSAGRLLSDLWRQLLRFLGRAWGAAVCLHRGPEARREAARFLATTVGHWRRTLLSLSSLPFATRRARRPGSATGTRDA